MAGDARRKSAVNRAYSVPSQQFAHPALQDLDPATKFLYTPHTITALIVGEWGRTFALSKRLWHVEQGAGGPPDWPEKGITTYQ
jgi:hypothetical protein